MKAALILFLVSSPLLARTLEYKEVHRTYRNLEKIDLSHCREKFRFLNNNWMDCSFHLPQMIASPVAQIKHIRTDKVEKTDPVTGTMNKFIRIDSTYRDMDDASGNINLWASFYYQLNGERTIHYGDRSLYQYEILENTLRDALATWNPEGKTIVAWDPEAKSEFMHDEVIGNVFFGMNSASLEAEKCLANYEHDQADNWPDTEEIWYSTCSYTSSEYREPIYLRDHWSKNLLAHSLEEVREISLRSEFVALVSYSGSSFQITLGKMKDGKPDYNLDLTPEEAAPLLREAATKAKKMSAHFFLPESGISTIKANDRILGKLILRKTNSGDLIDFE